jgi:CRISPR-associated protein Csx17
MKLNRYPKGVGQTISIVEYLSMLGLYRAILQRDINATLSFANGVEIRSKLSKEGVIDYLFNDFRPSPILSPWNGSAGFDGKPNKAFDFALESKDPRLEDWQEAQEALRAFLPCKDKLDLLWALRENGPVSFLPWFDACWVSVRPQGKVGRQLKANPMCGAGGNFGRLDISRKYLEAVALCLGNLANCESALSRVFERASFHCSESRKAERLRGFLNWSGSDFATVPMSFGSYAPGGSSESRNPWEFLFLVEGLCMLAPSRHKDVRWLQAALGQVHPTHPMIKKFKAEEIFSQEAILPTWTEHKGFKDVSTALAQKEKGIHIALLHIGKVREIHKLPPAPSWTGQSKQTFLRINPSDYPKIKKDYAI